MIAQQVGCKATRDALFLSSFEPEDLPRVVIAAAVAAMLAVFGASKAFVRFGPARVVPVAFGASAVMYVAEWALVSSAPRPVAVVLYLHTAVFGALVVSGFWSVVNERFDPHSAKRIVGRIGMGATFGGVIGGVLAERVGAFGHSDDMLAILAGMNALAAFGARRISDASPPARRTEESADNGFAILRRTPYLRSLAALVVLTAMSAGLLDYAFKAEAAHQFERGSDALLSFFAIFHTATAILSLLLQTVFARPALLRLGVAGTAATLPTIVLVTAAVGALVPRFATIIVARSAELVLANSIFRSGYELLYTPVALERKRPTKALIDVAGNRVGDALGSGMTLTILAFVPSFPIPVVLAFAAVAAALSLIVATRLHRGYVSELEESLRTGTPRASDVSLQAATMQTLSTVGLDREALFEQLAAQQSWSERATHPSLDGTEDPDPKSPDGIDAPDHDLVHEHARILRHGDVREIRVLLADGELDERLVPFAIALLARRDVHKASIAALRRVAERSVDALVKALTDKDQPFAIRRRLPRVLEVCESAKASFGLISALDDDRFEVRYRAALALARIVSRVPSLAPTPERVHQVVRAELEAGRKVWDSRRVLDEDTEEDAPLLDKALRDRVHRSVEHVFTLLSLAYDPEPLRLSLVAIASDDRALRGTALEYLESVLPDEIRSRLFPMLDVRDEMHKKRPRQEIVDELVLRSMRSMDAQELQSAIEKRGRP